MEKQLILPWDTDNFRLAWQLWRSYKVGQFGKSKDYKTLIGEQTALKQLAQMSGGREEIAIQIIEQSIGNTYQGLFPLKNSTNGNGFTNHKQQQANELNNYRQQLGKELGFS